MDKRYSSFFVILSVLIVILLGWGVFVMASIAVVSLEANNNINVQYDEGNFSINWTNETAGTDGTQDTSYAVYFYVDDVYYFGNQSHNDSENASGGNAGFMFSNLTEGNYTFTIEAQNETGSAGYTNSTNISIYIDRTAPVIDLRNSNGTQFLNATFKQQNTSTLTMNISVIDALSGETGSVCLVDINGTNQTVPVSNKWCNSTLINLTGVADGNVTIKVYVNDTVNITGLNNSFVVFVDATVPSATSSCTPSTPTDSGEQVTCTCSGTDSGTGVDTSLTTADSVRTADTAGSFTYDCSVTDNAGNSDTATGTYLVSGGGGTSSSGGGGGGGGGTTKSTTFTKITPGKVSIFKNFNPETGVKEIQIQVNNEAQNVKVTVTKYDNKPAAVSVEKTGKVYQYIQIAATNLETSLNKVTVQFKVEKSWISSNGLDKDKISVFKFNEDSNKWDELSTVYSGSDDTYEFFDVELTSFSFFAISEKTVVVEEEEDKGIVGDVLDGLGITGDEKRNLTWLWIVIAVLVVLVAVVMNREKFSSSKK